MKAKFGFIDPGAIMGVVVSLIILAVGVFAFFTVLGQTQTSLHAMDGLIDPSTAGSIQSIADNNTWNATQGLIDNQSTTGNSVFNIIGIVLIIGAIMAIVGLVYNYVK